ncbi:long-chain fatty acid--CoA ligase [Rathayibacter rathayi]|uniref:long-chain-fatty-acid--CoA ligase n=1 Tax=Rathayibacter rathayi TaxID=33887 RepID=UPI000BCA7DB6|nr:long-chain-fatty-acid--CoA ligase [Rathayibacter rathayi]AZZ48902.1 long-chain fatty acid--CoA ligase [Rathayibacter rathayi]MWV73997.1 AMP-binding protein [Rathayibacter rathayi NCPPB 2980 = VKM Ac-1601]PPF49497.1 long-chain fatty acid--CoA ligase [Rathayibacter rathayi]PPG71466.1 long-chain fatty acid--CoA ligase [Rathayibacter rathayi]PPG79370.1 long-chain fatty acid--CoA ligase [Rathayibacter rathayi]
MSTHPPRPWTRSYAPGVPTELELPTGSLLDIVTESAERYPQHVALEFFGRSTSYAQLADEVERAAEGLRRLGVRSGDPVALILPNCPQHVIAFYAVLRLGAVVVEHNPLYTPREFRHQFEDHGARLVIAWSRVVPTVQDLPADLGVETVIAVDLTRAMPAPMRAALRLPLKKARESRSALTGRARGAIDWESLLRRRIDSAHPRPTAEDLAVIQYTSGTTGTPKGAELTHANLTANAAQSRAWVPTVRRGDCVVYAVLPMFHAYGLTLCLTFAMSMGARLVLFPKFDPELVLKVVKKHPATFLPAVPPIAERLARSAQQSGVSLHGIEIAISGAMPLDPALVESFEALTGGTLVEGYGLSETSPVLMANPVGPTRRAGTVGLPLPGTDVRIVDPDDPGREMAVGEQGELIVRGPQVFRGYHRKPEETAATFTNDGWFRTGDIATIDEDGFVRIVDRLKELVITGGFNVSPSEVEEVLLRLPEIKEVAVVGLPDPHSGETVAAAVVLEPGAQLDVAAARKAVREALTAYKVPKRITVVDELPRNMIGKVLRRQVKAMLTDGD